MQTVVTGPIDENGVSFFFFLQSCVGQSLRNNGVTWAEQLLIYPFSMISFSAGMRDLHRLILGLTCLCVWCAEAFLQAGRKKAAVFNVFVNTCHIIKWTKMASVEQSEISLSTDTGASCLVAIWFQLLCVSAKIISHFLLKNISELTVARTVSPLHSGAHPCTSQGKMGEKESPVICKNPIISFLWVNRRRDESWKCTFLFGYWLISYTDNHIEA